MSASSLMLTVTAVDGYSAALRKAHAAAERLYWAFWWAQWGTGGSRRATALVIAEREAAR